jgi:hypothetical protein
MNNITTARKALSRLARVGLAGRGFGFVEPGSSVRGVWMRQITPQKLSSMSQPMPIESRRLVSHLWLFKLRESRAVAEATTT